MNSRNTIAKLGLSNKRLLSYRASLCLGIQSKTDTKTFVYWTVFEVMMKLCSMNGFCCHFKAPRCTRVRYQTSLTVPLLCICIVSCAQGEMVRINREKTRLQKSYTTASKCYLEMQVGKLVLYSYCSLLYGEWSIVTWFVLLQWIAQFIF